RRPRRDAPDQPDHRGLAKRSNSIDLRGGRCAHSGRGWSTPSRHVDLEGSPDALAGYWPELLPRLTTPSSAVIIVRARGGISEFTMDSTDTPTQAGKRWPLSLDWLRLRFRDPALELRYRDDRFRHNVGNIRFAFLAGIGLWVAWGLLLRPHILALADSRLDTVMRFGVFIPMLAVGLWFTFTARYIVDVSRVLATLYLISFGVLGGLAAYRLERFSRQVFLRERQLDRERERSDGLLLNILPQAIVEQLKSSSGGRIAQAFDQVTVVIADAVGSTEQGARSSPENFAAALDELFRRLDQIRDRH